LDGPFPASHTPSLKGDDKTNGDCTRTGTMMPSSADSSFGVPLEREGSATSNENRWRRADIRRSAGTVTYINAITRRPISSFPGLLFEAMSAVVVAQLVATHLFAFRIPAARRKHLDLRERQRRRPEVGDMQFIDEHSLALDDHWRWRLRSHHLYRRGTRRGLRERSRCYAKQTNDKKQEGPMNRSRTQFSSHATLPYVSSSQIYYYDEDVGDWSPRLRHN
jgi:hypothetical protein